MQPITREWIDKAEGDFQAALALHAVSEPVYDAVAFHAQQCAEKYLKARLIDAKVHFPRIHNLGALLDLVLPIEPTWAQLRPQLDALTLLGVEVRYPGTLADDDDAIQALETARAVRDAVRVALAV